MSIHCVARRMERVQILIRKHNCLSKYLFCFQFHPPSYSVATQGRKLVHDRNTYLYKFCLNVFLKLMILQTNKYFWNFCRDLIKFEWVTPFFMRGEVCASFSHQATMIKLCVSYRQDHPMCAMLAHHMPRYVKLH